MMPGKRNKKRQQEEKDNISHAIHGFPPFGKEWKGVEIKAQSGRNKNPEITKGVEIHDQRNG